MNGHYYRTSAFISLVLVIAISLHTVEGQRHRCFVCAPNTRKYADFQELKKMFGDTKIPKCSHYHNSRRHDFIQECPKDSKGCLTQFEDGSMLRTCASIGVDDCETANGVTYCYCKNELCNNPSKKLSNPNPGSGLLSSPQKSTELLIDTNKQKIEDNDQEMERDEVHHFGGEGSGDFDYHEYNYSDDSDDDYGPESEDQTEPPLFITEENDLYKNPPPPPRGNKDDFGFVEENNHLDHTSFRNSNNNNNAKSNHHSKSATSQLQPVITSGGTAPTGSQKKFVKLSVSTWLLLFSYAAFFMN